MNFANDFPDKLRFEILLSEVVGKKVALKQRGKEFIGLCPFHNEKSPSFTVNNQKGFYHCFGCQESGDAITFKMRSQGLDFKEAVIELANEFNVKITQISSNFDRAKNEQLDKNLQIAAKISEFFCKNLEQAPANQARQYLSKRGITSKIITKFRLGFAQNSYESLIKFLQKEGFSEVEILSCGVIGKNERGQFYDKFRNRIIFPITDGKGRVIAFGGRVLGDDLPKYLNSGETEIFKKSQTLYNLANARSEIFSQGYGILVEGYMDVVSLNIFGIENAVAGLGTAVSSEHLSQLFRITDKIIICLDGDLAGVKAAKRVSELALPLITSKKNLSFVLLPAQLDPDDYLKTFGVGEFKKLLKEAKSLSQFLLESAVQEACAVNKSQLSAEEKAKIAVILDGKIKEIKDENSKKFFAQFFKESLYFLGRKNEKYKNSSGKNFNQIASFKTAKILLFADKSQNLGLRILAFLIKFPWLVDYCDESFDLRNCHLANAEIELLKDFLVSMIDELANEESLQAAKKSLLPLQELSLALLNNLKNSEFSNFHERISDLLDEPSIQKKFNENELTNNFRLLLLKDFHLQLEGQYQDSLKNLTQDDALQTKESAVLNQNITEIFNQKKSLEFLIFKLEQEN